MATQIIEEFLPQTAKYINHVFDNNGTNRGGHHNHVIEQKIINLETPIADQCAENIAEIDKNMLHYLKDLDTSNN